MTRSIGLVPLLALLSVTNTMAAGDLTAQQPVSIQVELGTAADGLRFVPDRIDMETGKLYRVTLHNPSKQKHYFTAEQFAAAVFTRKVQVNDHKGKALAEVKGTTREIEVYPGGTTEWWLVPVKTGMFSELRCTIPGHAAEGMTGTITVR